MSDYSYSNTSGEKPNFGWGKRCERKPWSILEMGAVIGGFMVFWPLGLVALYLKHRNGEMWPGASAMQMPWRKMNMEGPWTQWKSPRDAADHFAGAWKKPNWGGQEFSASGNQAFDDYRKSKIEEMEALRRKLDEERAEFDAFLTKLRKSKDVEDFERFMAEKNTPKS